MLSQPVETNLLVLSYSNSPDVWLRNWQRRVGDLPSEVGFVHVGVKTRSAATRANAVPELTPTGSPLLADAISDPADLARIGIRVSEYLESWDGNGRQSVVYLDSMTELLENVALDRAFKFLHLLSARVESVNGRGYYLIDPSAHDDRSLGVMREPVDAVVNLDDPQLE